MGTTPGSTIPRTLAYFYTGEHGIKGINAGVAVIHAFESLLQNNVLETDWHRHSVHL